MSILTLIRPELSGLKPYEAAEQVENSIRLNANESSWSPCTTAFRRPLNRYPQIRPTGLCSKLSQFYSCDSDQLLVTRGSSEAIDLLIRLFCRAGTDNIVVPGPTFSMYEHYAKIQAADVHTLPLKPAQNFRLDSDELLSQCDERTKLVFLCTPNNPTGTTIPRATLKKIIEKLAGRSVVIVDEAYIEFSDESSCVELVSEFENLVVLRTLSKALASAGARCGSVIAQSDVIQALDAIQSPYAMATPVVECIEDAMSEAMLQVSDNQISATINERHAMLDALDGLDIVTRTWPSDANFVLAEFKDIENVLATTKDNGILIRFYGGTLKNCARISIGSRQENAALLDVLRQLDNESS